MGGRGGAGGTAIGGIRRNVESSDWLKKWSESYMGKLKRQRRKRNLRKSTQKDISGNIITQIVGSGKSHHRHTKGRNAG